MLNFSLLRLCLARRFLTHGAWALLFSLGLSACSTVQPLPVIGGTSAYGSWIELKDKHSLTLSPGVFLDLPDAPYRAKFADKDGTYFQASRSLQFRTQDGLITEAQGGLYVRYDKLTEATPWLYESLGAPLVPYPYLTPLKVQFFSGE
jgi:hypothetical protein